MTDDEKKSNDEKKSLFVESKTAQSKEVKSLLEQDHLSRRTELTLMFLSLTKKTKVIDIFRDVTFAKKDPFLENLMKPEYQTFIKFKVKLRQLKIF